MTSTVTEERNEMSLTTTASTEAPSPASSSATTREIGIIMNGVSGRMGYRQHLVRSILAIRDQVAPPTLNLHKPSRESIIDRVAREAQPRHIEVALSNSFGFGGTNASIVFRGAP